MEAAAIPLPRPERTPPVTMIYLVGMSKEYSTLMELYLVSERKLGIFSKIKEDENYNHRNTLRYFEDYNLSLSKRSVDPAQRGRRDWEK